MDLFLYDSDFHDKSVEVKYLLVLLENQDS